MKTLILGLLLALGAASPAQAVEITLFPISPTAAPGALFYWQFQLTNDTGNTLFVSGVESSFPSGDGFAFDDPAVTPDLDAYNLLYPDGLPDGSTSTLANLGYYHIAPGATPGATVGDSGGPCCVLTVSYDLFDGLGSYAGSSSVDSDFTSVTVTGAGPSIVTPEPASSMLMFFGVAAIIAAARKRAVK